MHNFSLSLFNITLYHFVLYFVFYSFAGWIGEVGYAYKNQKKFVNRGFLHGPFCPMYGACMLTILLLFGRFSNLNTFQFFVIATILTAIIEYFTGLILEKLFNQKWWDYTEDPFNLHGRICLHFSLMFGVLTTLGVKFIHPIIASILNSFNPKFGLFLFYFLLIYIFIDFSHTLFLLIEDKRATS